MRVLIVLLFVSSSVFAQTAQQEINEQVWKPFIKGFSEGDTELFMSVHSKELVRSNRDSKKVLNWARYKEQTAALNSKHAATSNIELHFTKRYNSDHQAVDIGIYKTSWSTPDGKKSVGYGRFHVVLRKENDTWKILVDMDSNEGKTIGEKQFLAAKPMM